MDDERVVTAAIDGPVTVPTLVADLRSLGVSPGMVLMVHSSLSSLGWVVGGAHAVVVALLEAVGEQGTVMMPTHSAELSDPEAWQNPPVPEHWWTPIRQEMPAYDPVLTPTSQMGAIVECFRRHPGARRSAHPTVSAAAVGPQAARLVDGHALAHGLGEGSPQARLHDLDGHVLLLGVTHENNTSLHLAEHRAAPPGAAVTTQSSPVLSNGRREWVTYPELVTDESDFDAIGHAFAATGRQRTGRVGRADARLMSARDLADFATGWLRQNRAWQVT